MTVDLWRQITAIVFLGVLAAWTINGAAAANRRDPIDNVITFELGALFFGLALGFWQAAHGGNPAWRVTYFTVVGVALLATLIYRLMRSTDRED